jgi:MoaA/NifB/PqqE/SkfB family radical SAM enzyme
MKLEEIGFYTLSDERADTASASSRLMRAEILLGSKCNFNCPYCRHVGGPDLSLEAGIKIIDELLKHNLYSLRLSGGEPTANPWLENFVDYAKRGGVEKIAISTNGSADQEVYDRLIDLGVNDFSISLDACCASSGDKMAGGIAGAWEKVVANTRHISSRTYVTVGVVLTADNIGDVNGIIKFADSLGVADIRIIPAAQDGDRLSSVVVDQDVLDRHPILKYRIENIRAGMPVRGLSDADSHRCGLVVDDVAIMGDEHFPCIIRTRERGDAIGKVGPNMREEREKWYYEHDTHKDPICRANCLDVCICHCNRFRDHNSMAVREA